MVGRVTRRAMLRGMGAATMAGALGAGRARASDAQYVFKVGTDIPEATPLNVYLYRAADAIRKESNGLVDLQIFPNNQLGADPDMFSQLRSGALECFLLSGINSLSTMIPKASIYGLGFIFEDDRTVYAALDGDLGRALREQIRSAGFVVTDNIWANGFRQITSTSRPVHGVKDLQNFKMRVPVSPMWVSTFKALGASPTAIAFPELYTALQTNVVDGQDTPLTLVSTAKLYEIEKYCAITNHMWDGYWCLFNRDAWAPLPDDLKGIVTRNLDATALEQRVEVTRQNDGLREELSKKGLAFNDVDRKEFRNQLRTAGYYASWKSTFGDALWSDLERYVGPLT